LIELIDSYEHLQRHLSPASNEQSSFSGGAGMTSVNTGLSLFHGIRNLILGLSVTLRHLFSRAVTLQYPTERWEMPERSRGVVVLLSDKETGQLNCTACILCAKACPTGAILIERFRGEDKRWKLTRFDIDNTICCYCGLCEEACNFTAIKLTPKYEFSSLDKKSLIYDVKRLQEIGLDVDYTPRPKKADAAATSLSTPTATSATQATVAADPPTKDEVS
jgi:NADH-quinone oxidoreductase subunit I